MVRTSCLTFIPPSLRQDEGWPGHALALPSVAEPAQGDFPRHRSRQTVEHRGYLNPTPDDFPSELEARYQRLRPLKPAARESFLAHRTGRSVLNKHRSR